jgi:hypothetical protein
MPDRRLDPKHNTAKDEFPLPYPFKGKAESEVRVSCTAMAQGEAWVKSRVEGWFKDHERPKPGTSMRIPDYQFDPSLFQPEGEI